VLVPGLLWRRRGFSEKLGPTDPEELKLEEPIPSPLEHFTQHIDRISTTFNLFIVCYKEHQGYRNFWRSLVSLPIASRITVRVHHLCFNLLIVCYEELQGYQNCWTSLVILPIASRITVRVTGGGVLLSSALLEDTICNDRKPCCMRRILT